MPCKTEEQEHTVCFDSCRDLCGSDVFNAAAVLFECILIILAVSFTSAFYGEGRGIEFLQNDIKALVGIDGFAMLSILTMLLAVLKPANVFVQKVLVTEKPDEKVKTRLKHGGCIGSLERFIIICMLLLGQYSAVALVFTAKSIVRFKDFEDRSFAEYYLYGTLLSVAVSIALFALLKIFGA